MKTVTLNRIGTGTDGDLLWLRLPNGRLTALTAAEISETRLQCGHTVPTATFDLYVPADGRWVVMRYAGIVKDDPHVR